MQKKRATLQRDRLRVIEAEIARHKRTQTDDTLQWITNELDEMAERLRADPDWREPTREEQEENRRGVEAAIRAIQRAHTHAMHASPRSRR